MRWFPRTFVAVAFVACRDPAPPLDAPLHEAPVSSASTGAAAGASAAPSQAHDAAPANPAHPPPEHRLERLAYAPDGTLVVFANDAIVSYSREAEVARVPLASDEVARPEATAAVLITGSDRARLLSLPLLREIYAGTVRTPFDTGGGTTTLVENHTRDEAVVILAPDGKSVKVLKQLPKGNDVTVGAVRVTAAGVLAVVSVSETNDAGVEHDRGVVYDVATGRAVAEVLPMNGAPGGAPATTLEGRHEIGFRGDELVVLDLATGATLHRARFHCGTDDAGYHTSGNPIVDPTGRRLIVTCDDDGFLFDYPSLRRVRTFPRLVPGCDNGPYLGGTFSDDGNTFTLTGCGGESRLDVRSGRFLCGDNDGLMGRPYDVIPGGPHERPKQAVGVPVCHTEAEREHRAEVVSAHFRVGMEGEDSVLTGAHKERIVLGPGYLAPVVTKDEARVAVIVGTHVVERALPSGNVLRTLDP